MTPVSPVFPDNKSVTEVIYAKDQPQYIPLPAYKADDGLVVTRWQLTWKERVRVLLRGSVWLSLLTFNKPLQPVRLDANPPIKF